MILNKIWPEVDPTLELVVRSLWDASGGIFTDGYAPSILTIVKETIRVIIKSNFNNFLFSILDMPQSFMDRYLPSLKSHRIYQERFWFRRLYERWYFYFSKYYVYPFRINKDIMMSGKFRFPLLKFKWLLDFFCSLPFTT